MFRYDFSDTDANCNGGLVRFIFLFCGRRKYRRLLAFRDLQQVEQECT